MPFHWPWLSWLSRGSWGAGGGTGSSRNLLIFDVSSADGFLGGACVRARAPGSCILALWLARSSAASPVSGRPVRSGAGMVGGFQAQRAVLVEGVGNSLE